jgi:hypothetical protein
VTWIDQDNPVEYLQHSAAIATDIIDQDLIDAIREARPGTFTPLGSRTSDDVAGGEVFLGINKYSNLLSRPERHLAEIATVETLIRRNPTLRPHLPVLTLGVMDGNYPMGVLTQDFTNNHTASLDERLPREPQLPGVPARAAELNSRIVAALEGQVNHYALDRAFGVTCGRLVLFNVSDIALSPTIVQPALAQVRERHTLARIDISQ